LSRNSAKEKRVAHRKGRSNFFVKSLHYRLSVNTPLVKAIRIFQEPNVAVYVENFILAYSMNSEIHQNKERGKSQEKITNKQTVTE